MNKNNDIGFIAEAGTVIAFIWANVQLRSISEITMTAKGPEKLLYLTLGIIFLALGIVGLLIPILPGILFLGGAVYMLSRGSNRVREYAENSPQLREWQLRMQRLDAVDTLARIKVAGLMAVQSVVVGAQKLITGLRRLMA